ncbi:MAG TPA: MBL fold metallo-hydrolase [Dehalococcoidia bacterium]
MTQPDVSSKAPVPPPEVREVAPRVFAYLQPDWRWGLNNTGILLGREALTLIDTCFTEGLTRRFLEHAARLSPRPVRALINTHHHADHTFGNWLAPEAAVIGQEACREEIRREGLFAQSVFPGVTWGRVEPRPPFITFRERLAVFVDDLLLEVIAVGPAHTRGDAVVWIPEHRVLFAGDVLFKDATPFVAQGSVSGSLRALAVLRALGAETVVPGHGPVCGPEVYDEVEGYLRFVQEAAQRALAEGLTPLEAARRTDLGPYAAWGESERIVGNLARAMAELQGEAPGAPLRGINVVAQMVEYAGRPLHCP